MSDSDVECAKLKFELLVVKRERDDVYQERDTFMDFFRSASNKAKELTEEKRQLEEKVQELQEMLLAYQNNADCQTPTAAESSSSDEVREQEEGRHDQETENEQATLAEVSSERDLLKLEYESLSNELMEKSSENKALMIQLDEERDDNEELSNILRSVAQPKVIDTEQEEGVEQDMKATREKLTDEEKRELQEKIRQLHEMLSEYQNGADHQRPTVEEKSPSDGVGEQEEVRHVETEDETEEKHELQEKIRQLQEMLSEYQNGADHQRPTVEEKSPSDGVGEQEEVRHVETEDEQATLAEVCSQRDQFKKENESLSYQLLEKSSRINELEMDLFDRTNEIDELKALVESQQANIALDTAKTLADMELKVTRNEQMGLDLKKSVDAMAEKLADITHQLERKEEELSAAKEELASISGSYDGLRRQHKQLCHSMQRRVWLDRRLRSHFRHLKTPTSHQPFFVVHSQKRLERLLSLVRQRRAAVFMECLSFAFYVAKQRDAARGRIINGMAVSNDDEDEWETVEGVADLEGMADLLGVAQEHPVKIEEAGHMGQSELVLSSSVCKFPGRIPPVDVVREDDETQDKTVHQQLQTSSTNLVCPSSVDHFSWWSGNPHCQRRCRHRHRVICGRSRNRCCLLCGQPRKRPTPHHCPCSVRCGRCIFTGGWAPTLVTFRRMAQRYMRGVT